MAAQRPAAACHTGHADEVAALFDRAVAEFGKVDGLVNNAATNPYFGPTLGVTDSAFDKIFEVNVKGSLYACREFAARAKGGAIVRALHLPLPPGHGSHRWKTSVAFVPPKPKELLRTLRASAFRAWLGT